MRQSTGKTGESIAVNYLIEKGYLIRERNWRCSRGEVDIVAMDGDILVFCEVKTRRAENVSSAFVNITEAKQKKMILVAQHYVYEHDLNEVVWRIDAIAIALPRHGETIIAHVEDVLDW